MEAATEERINAARGEVDRAAIPPERKDGLQVMLDHAHKCANGHPDKIQAMSEGLSDVIVHIVRNETREIERTRAEIAAHMATCKIGHAPKSVKEFAMQVAAQYPLIATLVALWAAEKFGLEGLAALFK